MDDWMLLRFCSRLKTKSITPSRRFTTNTTAPTRTLLAVLSTMCRGRWERASFHLLNSAHFLQKKKKAELYKTPKLTLNVNIPAPLLRHPQLLWLEEHPLVQRVQEQQRPGQLLSAQHHQLHRHPHPTSWSLPGGTSRRSSFTPIVLELFMKRLFYFVFLSLIGMRSSGC